MGDVNQDFPPFEEVYRAHADTIFRFCIWMLRDLHAAEDVAADVFVAAFKAYERARPTGDGVQTWLLRIARNTATSHLRRSARLGRALTAIGRRTPAPLDVEGTAELNGEMRLVLEILGTMKQRDQLLIGLRCGGGLSFREIAEMTGMTEVGARTATYRAAERLRVEFINRSGEGGR